MPLLGLKMVKKVLSSCFNSVHIERSLQLRRRESIVVVGTITIFSEKGSFNSAWDARKQPAKEIHKVTTFSSTHFLSIISYRQGMKELFFP